MANSRSIFDANSNPIADDIAPFAYGQPAIFIDTVNVYTGTGEHASTRPAGGATVNSPGGTVAIHPDACPNCHDLICTCDPPAGRDWAFTDTDTESDIDHIGNTDNVCTCDGRCPSAADGGCAADSTSPDAGHRRGGDDAGEGNAAPVAITDQDGRVHGYYVTINDANVDELYINIYTDRPTYIDRHSITSGRDFDIYANTVDSAGGNAYTCIYIYINARGPYAYANLYIDANDNPSDSDSDAVAKFYAAYGNRYKYANGDAK